MHRQPAILTTFGVKKLHSKLDKMKGRYESISQALKDKTESYDILAIKQVERGMLIVDILNIERILSSAQIIAKDNNPLTAGQGTTVVYVHDSTAIQKEVTLVDPLEADPFEGFVSIESPLGSALLGCNVEDTVLITTPKGINRLTIVRLT